MMRSSNDLAARLLVVATGVLIAAAIIGAICR